MVYKQSRGERTNQTMAESIATLLVQHLPTLLAEANKFLGELGDDLQFTTVELARMTAFLRVADAVEDDDPQIAVWVKEVRKVVHDTEDAVDEYDLLFLSHRGSLWRIYTIVKNFRALSRLASEIRSIRPRVRDISDAHKRYSGTHQDQAHVFGVPKDAEVEGRGAALHQDEADLVGIEQPKEELIRLLLDGDSKLKVISVVGMGGTGKTALVKKVYKDESLWSHFQCHAWVTVSKSFNQELLMNFIGQLYRESRKPVPQQEVQSMNGNELKEFIKKFLQKKGRYFIVFDDVWHVESWKEIESVLPKNSSKCRVMLTTRAKDVALASCTNPSENVYEMKPLSSKASWTLFCNRAFKGGSCPPQLKKISEDFLKKCRCLPLAIVAIGGVLALKDQRLDDWEVLYRSLGVELEADGKLQEVKRILLLSFYDLPYHLKLCLLYLTIFPAEHIIDFMKVIRLWVSEGFVQEKNGLTKEEVGEQYLRELINRSLVQVVGTTYDHGLKACRVHNILREIFLSKSRDQNFVTVLDEKASELPNGVRRLAIHGLSKENTTAESSNFRQLRSLLLFPSDDPLSMSFISNMLGGSPLLKVLDLSGAPLEMIPDEVFGLFHLSYLSLRSTKVKSIPKSIGRLRNLETLDLKNTFVKELPVEILKLRRLRHLLVYNFSGVLFLRAPYKIGRLMSLQKLCYIEAGEKNGVKIVREIGKLTELRKLGISNLRKEDGKDLCSSLGSLTNLRSLDVWSAEVNEVIDLEYHVSSITHLRSLSLRGRLEKMPQWIPSLQGLTKCCLMQSTLKDEPLQHLEDLPNLVYLSLERAYEGEELHFKAGKFQLLKDLNLWSLEGMRRVNVEESSMPCLQMLHFGDCKLMDELPSGIEHLSKLQCVYLFDMAEKLVESLKNGENRRSTQAQIYVAYLENGQFEWSSLSSDEE